MYFIGGVRVYPSRAPGLTLNYWWGSSLPFTSTWVHPRLLVGFVFTLHEHLGSPSINGGVRVYSNNQGWTQVLVKGKHLFYILKVRKYVTCPKPDKWYDYWKSRNAWCFHLIWKHSTLLWLQTGQSMHWIYQ
jgi:hypothetical protein